MTRDIEHRNAVDALIRDPTNAAKAQRVLRLAIDDPRRASIVRESIAPAHPMLPLDLRREEYRRNNLRMPERPKRVTSPDRLRDLIEVMKSSADRFLPLKAIGDGYGFANTGFTRGTLISFVNDMDDILEVEANLLREPNEISRLLQFESGATIEKLNTYLSARGLALLNQPGFDKLTFAGTMSSGGHGSGIWSGPLSSQVRSIHLLTVGSQREILEVRVEPKNGITDPAKWKLAHPHVELVQDDDLFHACTCSMGCLGVIYALTIEIRGAYSVLENRRKLPWTEVRAMLPQLLAEQGPHKRLHSVEIWINPYAVDGEVRCVLGERSETKDPPRGERGLGIEFGGSEFLFRVLSWWMQHHPSTIPCLIDAALGATESLDVVRPAPEGLNFGGPNQAPVLAAAVGVPAANIGDTADGMIDFFQKRRTVAGANITSPIGLRFVKAAEAHLSPAHGRDTCMIEVPILEGTPHARETLGAFLTFMYEQFGGRPHWGQYNPMPGDHLDSLYPALPAFLQTFKALNPKGYLDNAFTEQMGFRVRT